MSHNTTNRPRMAATYAPGTMRARSWHGDGDVRGYRPPRGWIARARFQGSKPKRPFAAFGQAAKGPRTSSLVRKSH